MGLSEDSLKRGRMAAIAPLIALIALALVCLVPAPLQAQDTPEPTAAYRLLPGDEISVQFPLNAELDAEGPIGPDGRFSVPLLGRVVLGGLTLDQAEATIDSAMLSAGIIANARTSIAVANFAGVVYVGGEVAKPGSVRIISALNPVQAITEAGGLLNTARSKKIAIIRPNGTESAVVQTINMRKFVKSGLGNGSVRLQAGDIVFVPKSTIAEINVWLDQHINKIIPNALNLNWNFGDFGANTNGAVNVGTPTGQ